MSKGAIRAQQRTRSQARKKRKRVLWMSLVGAIAVMFIGALLVPGGLRGSRHSNAGLNTGGPVPILTDAGAGHIDAGLPGGPFNSVPATSGIHWDVTPPSDIVPTGAPARWGVYTDPIPDEVLVHNLEHGGIGLHYNCPDGCDELIDQLTALVSQGAAQFIVAPYPGIDSRIALTAWRHLDTMEEFDEARISDFIRAYQDRAPESVPFNQF